MRKSHCGVRSVIDHLGDVERTRIEQVWQSRCFTGSREAVKTRSSPRCRNRSNAKTSSSTMDRKSSMPLSPDSETGLWRRNTSIASRPRRCRLASADSAIAFAMRPRWFLDRPGFCWPRGRQVAESRVRGPGSFPTCHRHRRPKYRSNWDSPWRAVQTGRCYRESIRGKL